MSKRHYVSAVGAARTPKKSFVTLPDTETLSWLARIGYATRGSVFLIMGGLALLAAGGSADRPLGMRDALELAFNRPFVGFMLWIVAVGLGCFAGWRLLQSILDVDGVGHGVYGLMRRASFAIAGIFYLALATATARITVHPRTETEDQAARSWTYWAMSKPLGRDLVAIIAVALICVAISIAVQVVRAPYRHEFDRDQVPLGWVIAIGSFGLATRAFVFLMLGVFLGMAVYDYDAGEARSLSGVLGVLQAQASYGRLMLIIAGFGLLAFGGFELVEAYARRVIPIKKRRPKIDRLLTIWRSRRR